MNFADIATILTDYNQGRIDWHNTSGKFRQRAKNSLWALWTLYSWDELLQLSIMWTVSLAAGYYGAQSCKDDNCSSLLRGSTAALATMTGAHFFTVAPKYFRRNAKIEKNHQLCLGLIEQLGGLRHEATTDLNTLIDTMQATLRLCDQMKLPHLKRGDADRNIMYTTHFLAYLKTKIESFTESLSTPSTNRKDLLQETEDFWQQSPQILYETFKDEQENPNTITPR
ncbi:MAG: hypothetical protein EPN84_12680 [Legionella sp.]|nr:MAG: hypothetical protein EPN84_12680 [Legionella sp.]